MNPRACPRSWQAEAAEDGRLSAADVASFERHAATCAVCRAEVTALATLRETALRLPALTSTALERRRLRNAVLRRANDLVLRAPPRARLRWIAVASAAAALVALVAFWPRPPEAAPAAVVAPESPTFDIVASPGAQWVSRERGPTVRLALTHGRIDLSVDPLRSGQRFLLELPDGELEVKGTRFVVEVDGARTVSVRVLEGRVALRLKTQESRALGAGEHYVASAPSIPSALPSSAASTAPPPASAPQVASASPAPAPSAAPPPDSSAAQDAKPLPTAAPANDFSLAMAAFSAGDYGRAERLFLQFADLHPADSRNEDALFLRAVARSRRGDTEGARALSLEYLKRYPSGFRRPEAEALARRE